MTLMTRPLRPYHTKCAACDVEPTAQVPDDEVERDDFTTTRDSGGGRRFPLHDHVRVGAEVGRKNCRIRGFELAGRREVRDLQVLELRHGLAGRRERLAVVA